jgi:hypothetical protein
VLVRRQGNSPTTNFAPSVFFVIPLTVVRVDWALLPRHYLGFPIWFVVHDWRGLFFVIFVIFVLLHSFATHFFNPSPVFLRRGDLPLTILAPMPGFFRL